MSKKHILSIVRGSFVSSGSLQYLRVINFACLNQMITSLIYGHKEVL